MRMKRYINLLKRLLANSTTAQTSHFYPSYGCYSWSNKAAVTKATTTLCFSEVEISVWYCQTPLQSIWTGKTERETHITQKAKGLGVIRKLEIRRICAFKNQNKKCFNTPTQGMSLLVGIVFNSPILQQQPLSKVCITLEKVHKTINVEMCQMYYKGQTWLDIFIRKINFFSFLWQFNISTNCTSGVDWHQSLVNLNIVYTVFRTWVRSRKAYPSPLKKGVWGAVHVNSGTVHCRTESANGKSPKCNCIKSQKWNAINDVLFDKNLCLCFTHFPNDRV